MSKHTSRLAGQLLFIMAAHQLAAFIPPAERGFAAFCWFFAAAVSGYLFSYSQWGARS